MAAQLPDLIVIDGIYQELYSNPLEQFWSTTKERRPLFISSNICKRGYVATWEIIEKCLVLKAIEGQFEKRYFLFWKKLRNYSIRNLLKKSPISNTVATWFTGKIRVPLGNRILYVHNEYDSRFEKELILTIDHGKVVKSLVLDYTHETLQVLKSEIF
jgi:hypothetical protein